MRFLTVQSHSHSKPLALYVPLYSRKGTWQCARAMATHTGMTNQWLAEQGLLSAKEL
jgi:hypothetical protein